MRYVKPKDYDNFKCIADQCPDTCCAGWQIVIDEETLEKYADSRGDFSERLKASIDWEEGSFKQYGRRCAMLNENNLCDLVTAKGEGWLCRTCDRYPRHIEEFDGVREMSLSLSCPVAAEMMLKNQERMQFLVEEDDAPDPLEEEFEDFDFLLFSQLQDARNVLFDIVQNREFSIESRLQAVEQMGAELQLCLDEGRLFDMEEILQRYGENGCGAGCSEEVKKRGDSESMDIPSAEAHFCRIRDDFQIFHELEHLREEWPEIVAGAETTLYDKGYEQYATLQAAFEEEFVAAYGTEKWNIFQEQILMFFLYTYFCGAVYDECIYSKTALAVFSVRYIREFILCEWLQNGRAITQGECIRLAYRYAREVEHSDVNLNLLEERFMKNFDENMF